MRDERDEYLDFAPAKHAVREAFAFCTVASLVLGLAGYGLWTLVNGLWTLAGRVLGAWG